ncbi:hypothetical protein EYF80_050558 [Liparis tanakae]|uniref:Uncharacterized protein n=1 Tax=Liparis tanakae TaxID=230148 RepID=A0A4Z2FDJ5_9TELE|nr:hypothetical protein EYF80_050558 [Liparis tanakae]
MDTTLQSVRSEVIHYSRSVISCQTHEQRPRGPLTRLEAGCVPAVWTPSPPPRGRRPHEDRAGGHPIRSASSLGCGCGSASSLCSSPQQRNLWRRKPCFNEKPRPPLPHSSPSAVCLSVDAEASLK